MKLSLKNGKLRNFLLFCGVYLLILLYYVWLFWGNKFLPLPIYLKTNWFVYGSVFLTTLVYVTVLIFFTLTGRISRLLGSCFFLFMYPGFFVLFITFIALTWPVDVIQAGESRIHLSSSIMEIADPWGHYLLHECDLRDRNCELQKGFAVPSGIYQRSMSVDEFDGSVQIVINDVYEYEFYYETNKFIEIYGFSP